MKESSHMGASRETLASAPTSPSQKGKVDYTSTTQKLAKDRDILDASESVYFSRLWIKENPEAWQLMVDIAHKDAREKKYISISRVVELARMMDFHQNKNKPFKINNQLRPGLARILAQDYPELAPFIRFRRAACDGMVRDV